MHVRMFIHCCCYNSQGIRKNTPGAVVDILEHPLDKSKVPCMQYMNTCIATIVVQFIPKIHSYVILILLAGVARLHQWTNGFMEFGEKPG